MNFKSFSFTYMWNVHKFENILRKFKIDPIKSFGGMRVLV